MSNKKENNVWDETEIHIHKKKQYNHQQCNIYSNQWQEPYKKQPDRIIELLPTMKIIWIHDQKKDPSQLKGFKIIINKEEFEYRGDEVVLYQLKDSFAKYSFQYRLQDEYDVVQEIGKGNYARVYSIRHRLTNKKYACKCFEKKKLITMDKGIISLHNEIEIMRALPPQSNIVRLKEVYEGENTYYLVMDLSEGSSLYDEIKLHQNQEKPFTQKEIQSIIKDLTEGIACCASKKVMHRDLKPENLLFKYKDSYSTLQIVDYGLASFSDRAPYIFPKCGNQYHQILGTPGFVAPEIANLTDKQSSYSEICDVFSIGVIFHILLTGEAVFPGKKFNEVLKKNKQCKINIQDPLYDKLQPQARDLLTLLLQPDPSKRISAQEALQHEYFEDQNKNFKQRSEKNLDIEEKIQSTQIIETAEILKQKYPYYNKYDIKIVEQTEDTITHINGSFFTQDVLFVGPKKDINKHDILITSQDNTQQDQVLDTKGSLCHLILIEVQELENAQKRLDIENIEEEEENDTVSNNPSIEEEKIDDDYKKQQVDIQFKN